VQELAYNEENKVAVKPAVVVSDTCVGIDGLDVPA
jgi:hypothetical protein